MDTKFQTSFIPKTTLEPVNHVTRRPVGFFSFISSIIFFISIVVAGGAFGWHKYLDSSKAKLKSNLEKNIKSFEPQTLDEYYRLNNRIDSAKELLSKHVAVSYIFDFLSEETLQSIKFNDFKYDVDPVGGASLTINGEAKSYNAIAYQSQVLGKERALKNPIFSNLDLDTTGNVIFNFTTKVDPGFIVYTRKANKINTKEANDNFELLPQSNPGITPALLVPPASTTPAVPTAPIAPVNNIKQ